MASAKQLEARKKFAATFGKTGRPKKTAQAEPVAVPVQAATPSAKTSGVPVSLVVKIIGGIVITALVYVAGRWVYKTFFLNKADEAVNTAVDDVTVFRNSGMVQTYPDTEYNTIADSAYEGMRYAAISDNYSMVVTAMKLLRNNIDVALTVVAYATRQEYNFGVPVGQKKNLFQQIADDLSDDKRKEINDDWNSKQISYRV